MYHPELFGYQLNDVKVLYGLTAEEKMRVILTFENSHEKLGSLFEVEIGLTRVSVLSNYSYSYE